MDEIELLYEDNHLLVVVKPPGVPSQEDATGDPNMLTRMKAYIKAAYQKPGEVYLGLVHRLDRPVGGIMCFARTSKAAARLSAQLKSGAFRKTYLAVVEGETPVSGVLTDYLYKVEEENHVYVADENTPGAKLAKLAYRTLAKRSGLSLVEIELFTGRSHQIRVQLAEAGFPLWGDHRYGHGKSKENIALFAARLKIEHPTKPMSAGDNFALGNDAAQTDPGRTVNAKTDKLPLEFVKAPPAAVYPWSLFPVELSRFSRTRGGVAVVYEDAALVIAEKQPGIETQGEISVESAVSELVGAKVFACHRLDAMTGGLIMLAKTERAREAAEAALKARLVQNPHAREADSHAKDIILKAERAFVASKPPIAKTYRCIVKGVPEPREARLTAYLLKDADKARVSVYANPAPGAKRIETGYRVLEHANGLSLLEVALYTGRTHQIRAHMAFLGHPLLGDDKYGDRALNKAHSAKHQALWATALEFSDTLAGELAPIAGKRFESVPMFSSGDCKGASPLCNK